MGSADCDLGSVVVLITHDAANQPRQVAQLVPRAEPFARCNHLSKSCARGLFGCPCPTRSTSVRAWRLYASAPCNSNREAACWPLLCLSCKVPKRGGQGACWPREGRGEVDDVAVPSPGRRCPMAGRCRGTSRTSGQHRRRRRYGWLCGTATTRGSTHTRSSTHTRPAPHAGH